jgi:Uma2 family endonuclease
MRVGRELAQELEREHARRRPLPRRDSDGRRTWTLLQAKIFRMAALDFVRQCLKLRIVQAVDVDPCLTSELEAAEPDPDQRVFLHDLSWSDYEQLLAMRGERSGVRIAFLRGEVELMSPSRSHETLKTMIARLLEAYAEERSLPLNGFGSWTIKSAPKERGVEPDECYSLGEPGDAPDIAIEVVWTHGGLDKLELYRLLGVREAWIWRRAKLSAHLLRGERYEAAERSELIPELDFDELLTFASAADQTDAVRRYRRLLRGELRPSEA